MLFVVFCLCLLLSHVTSYQKYRRKDEVVGENPPVGRAPLRCINLVFSVEVAVSLLIICFM